MAYIKFTPMPGDLLEHNLSKAKYWYIGDIPESNMVALIQYGQVMSTAYTIGRQELSQYYTKIAAPSKMVEGKTYVSKLSGAHFQVEKVLKNPGRDELVAFGWYIREPEHSSARVAHHVEEALFERYTPLD